MLHVRPYLPGKLIAVPYWSLGSVMIWMEQSHSPLLMVPGCGHEFPGTRSYSTKLLHTNIVLHPGAQVRSLAPTCGIKTALPILSYSTARRAVATVPARAGSGAGIKVIFRDCLAVLAVPAWAELGFPLLALGAAAAPSATCHRDGPLHAAAAGGSRLSVVVCDCFFKEV